MPTTWPRRPRWWGSWSKITLGRTLSSSRRPQRSSKLPSKRYLKSTSTSARRQTRPSSPSLITSNRMRRISGSAKTHRWIAIFGSFSTNTSGMLKNLLIKFKTSRRPYFWPGTMARTRSMLGLMPLNCSTMAYFSTAKLFSDPIRLRRRFTRDLLDLTSRLVPLNCIPSVLSSLKPSWDSSCSWMTSVAAV